MQEAIRRLGGDWIPAIGQHVRDPSIGFTFIVVSTYELLDGLTPIMMARVLLLPSGSGRVIDYPTRALVPSEQ